MMPGMPDLSQILIQAQQMQAEMQRAQASLAEAEVTGSAGGGLVTAVVNGSGDLLRFRSTRRWSTRPTRDPRGPGDCRRA